MIDQISIYHLLIFRILISARINETSLREIKLFSSSIACQSILVIRIQLLKGLPWQDKTNMINKQHFRSLFNINVRRFLQLLNLTHMLYICQYQFFWCIIFFANKHF